jgi:hypothetical protein
VDAVDHGLELAAQHRERSTQFVAHVGEQRAPLPLVRLQASGHRVERLDEPAQLPHAVARHLDPGAEVAGADLARCLDQGAERDRETPCAPGRAREGEDQDQREENGGDRVRAVG